MLTETIGKEEVAGVTFDDLLDCEEQFSDNGDMQGRAIMMLGHLKRVVRFGAISCAASRAATTSPICSSA